MAKQPVLTLYQGGNEHLDRIRDGETIWIANGLVGRYPIIADTEEEALERYQELVDERHHKHRNTIDYHD